MLSNTVKYFRALKEKQYIKVSVFYFCYRDNRILSADLNLLLKRSSFTSRIAALLVSITILIRQNKAYVQYGKQKLHDTNNQ